MTDQEEVVSREWVEERLTEVLGAQTSLITTQETMLAMVERLHADVATYRSGVLAEGQRLRLEAEAARVLNRYSRRTWFAMAAGIIWFVLNLGDAARAYAHSAWWDLVFWPTQHHPDGMVGPGSHWFQVVGFAWQMVALVVLQQRAQVPAWLLDRVKRPESMTEHNDQVKRLLDL